MAAMAADSENKEPKEQPRPAQESRSGSATGKEATKPVTEAAKPATTDAEKPAPRSEPKEAPKEDAKTQPRPAQESRSGATTGREATKSPETPKEEAPKAK